MKKYIFNILLLMAVYIIENISINILKNVIKIDINIATLVAVLIFSPVVIFSIKKEGFAKPTHKNSYCITTLIATCLLIIINLFPFYTISFQDFISISVQMIFVGMIEELIFRGYIYHQLLEKKGSKYAVIWSSILFGCIHFINIFNDDWKFVILQIIYATAIGIIYSIAVDRTQNLLICSVSHTLINISNNISQVNSVAKECIFTITCLIIAFIAFYRHFYKHPKNEQ